MFFIGGITQGTKELVYNAAAMICGRCGRYGRYQVFIDVYKRQEQHLPENVMPFPSVHSEEAAALQM